MNAHIVYIYFCVANQKIILIPPQKYQLWVLCEVLEFLMSTHNTFFFFFFEKSRPSCLKLMMSLVNVSLKL